MPIEFPEQSNSAAGTLLRVNATLPDSHDVAGWQALHADLNWIEVGYVTAFDGIFRKVVPTKKVPTFNQGQVTIAQTPEFPDVAVTVLFQDNDTGQDFVETNDGTETEVAWDLVLNSGLHISALGWVNSYAPNLTSPDDEVQANFTIVIVPDVNGTGVVRWNPA